VLKCPPLEGLHLTEDWYGLGQSVIDDAVDEWHKRLWACVQAKEGHF